MKEKHPFLEELRFKFKKGETVIYNFPRMKRGIKVLPEVVVVKSKLYNDGKIKVQFKSGVVREVLIDNLEHTQ